jgi:hypothetical protein
VDIPSFLNRIDFISILLPGYVAVTTYLLVFQPTILFSEQAPEFDIISALLFIVAGPALGLTLAQFHRSALAIYRRGLAQIHTTSSKKKKREKFLREYASVRLKMTTEEKTELHEVEAFYDFSISSGLALCALSLFGFLKLGLLRFEPFILLIGGLVLLVGGYLQWSDAYSPMIRHLIRKYTRPSDPNTRYE